MATDIYLSKAVLEQFFSSSSSIVADLIELWHKPCGLIVYEAEDVEERNAWAFMEAMSKHVRECGATITRKMPK